MSNGAVFDIRRTETSSIEFYRKTTYLPGGGNNTYTTTFGPNGDPVTNVAALAVRFAKESHIGIRPSQNYQIIADAGSSGYSQGTNVVRIGTTSGAGGSSDALWKYVVAHEMGHAIQDQLFGILEKNYDGHSSSNQLCNCSHVDNTYFLLNQKHCLQSRETIEAVQNEGFAHFIALDAMNSDGESDGVFTYYKEFRWTNGGILPPPQGFLPRNAARWMKTKCPTTTSHVGIELDWMSFYFALHTIGGSANFYYTQIRDTYLDTCNNLGGNGTCSGLGSSNGPKWNGLTAAVGARYGSASARLDHWTAQGAAFGVDQ